MESGRKTRRMAMVGKSTKTAQSMKVSGRTERSTALGGCIGHGWISSTVATGKVIRD